MALRTSLTATIAAAGCALLGVGAAVTTSASAQSPTQLPVPRPVITAGAFSTSHGGQNRLGAPASLSPSAPRVFANARTGFATADEPLAGESEGAIYPLRSTDGGRRWTIDGPPFMFPGTAQAGITLGELGIANADQYWAYGPASQVLYVTDDAGRSWYQVPFGSSVQSVSRVGRYLLAYIDVSNETDSRGTTWQYTSEDGGRVWRYSTLMPPA